MADSLVLTGVKQVTKHKGNEMLRVNPKRGDVHKIKRWWTPNTVSTVYEGCTLFKVAQSDGVCYLAINVGHAETFKLRIDLADNFEFNFYGNIGISRAALFDENMQIIEHYVFPAISGGKIMTVTPADGASRPTNQIEVPEVPEAPEEPEAPAETIEDRAAAADITHQVTVSTYYGNERFYIDGNRQAEVTANSGQTIYFDLSDSSLSGYPFAIYTDETKTTTVTVGIETSEDGSILLFTPPITGSFSYQCSQQDEIGGDITVS